ncbi:chitin disaccharide deacetylase [Gracilibacillus timonensis]|uniref:chitin disaccharide deacetylase n=1 Tax=Gracilibacillus timonensis TaxID=1816696 RepID=UPI000826EA5B|nr:chitin disaccharide deacetylase [Gracilibacillus timonensis]
MDILFNADDFGITKGVSNGIIQAHQHGVISSTTIMMNGLAVDYAIDLAKQCPSLDIGLHLILTSGKPLFSPTSSLTNERGMFRFTNRFYEMDIPCLDDVRDEWRAQIEAFLATGLPLHHLDSHHHIHGWQPLKEIVIELADKYQIPVRCQDTFRDRTDLLLTEALWVDFYGDGAGLNIFERLHTYSFSSVEVMTHPGRCDGDLYTMSSYTVQREKELDILCNLSIPSWANVL